MADNAEDDLNVRHATCRLVVEAIILIYQDGRLTDEERRTVGRAADVLQALLERG